MSAEELEYYTTQSALSNPGRHGGAFACIPSDPARLIAAISGLVLHRGFVAPMGVTPDPSSAADGESRALEVMLDRILERDPSPLDVPRPPEKRFIGVCRDYAMLGCAALRQHGIPARLRVGFANYFTPGFNEDHWVCEYFVDGHWRLLDLELSERVRQFFKIPFEPADVPRDRFLVAGDAWLRYRRGALDAGTCGVSAVPVAGPWFAAASVVRDLAAVNKREMLAWDYWGLARGMRPGVTILEETAARIDAAATVIAPPDLHWPTVRNTYENDDALRVLGTVLSFTRGGAVEVKVPA